MAMYGCATDSEKKDGRGGAGPVEPGPGAGADAGAGGDGAAGIGGEAGASTTEAGGGAGGQAGADSGGAGGEAGQAVLYDFLGPTSNEVTTVTSLVQTNAFLHATSDAAGNLVFLVDAGQDGQRVEKYNAKLEYVETLSAFQTQLDEPVHLTHVTTATDGSVFVTGSTPSALPGEAANSGGGVLLARYTAESELQWISKVPANAEGAVVSVVTGTPVVWGTGEALPGQPASVFAGAFVAQFDAEGQFVSAKQGGDYRDQALNHTFMPDGALYLINQYVDSNNAVARYDAQGNLEWEYPEGFEAFSFAPALAASAERGYAFVSSGFNACTVVELLDTGTGWMLAGESTDVAASEEERTSWQGIFAGCAAIAATGSDVYVAGSYQLVENDVGNDLAFVARLDARGKQRWFRLLALPEEAEGPITHLLPSASGNVVVAGSGGFLFELRGRDGAPLSSERTR